MQTAAEGVEDNGQGGQTQGLPFFSRGETSPILFPGEQILLDTTAFHLDSRGPDSDLFSFQPGSFYSISHNSTTISFPSLPPTAFSCSKMPLDQRHKATCRVSHTASLKEAVGLPAGRLGHFSGCWVPPGSSRSFEPSRSTAGPRSFSPASVVETGSFS